MTSKSITLQDFLTKAELLRVFDIYMEPSTDISYAERVCKEIIEPNMERINKALGQENDAMYLAYVIEYRFLQFCQNALKELPHDS